jgi:serine/threonine-protein kinase HipA
LNLPGVFYDSLPDAWGQRIMERWFKQTALLTSKQSIESISALEQLCFIGNRGVGALSYQPALDVDDPLRSAVSDTLDLRRIELDARALITGPADDILPELTNLARNGTAGGARPKLWVSLGDDGKIISAANHTPHGFTPWLLKLDVRGTNEADRQWGRVEHAFELMAKASGITTSETRLIETKDEAGATRAHFAIRRFDRLPDDSRVHFHSLAGMQELDYASHGGGERDYRTLLAVTARACSDLRECEEVIRRAAFNAAARVRDDHAKNHGFLLDPTNKQWRLSPAYDVVHASPTKINFHALALAGNANDPGVPEIMRLADEVGCQHKVPEILGRILDSLAQWPKFAAQAGMTPQRTSEIQSFLPGLNWRLPVLRSAGKTVRENSTAAEPASTPGSADDLPPSTNPNVPKRRR